jgi:hypothetical protein
MKTIGYTKDGPVEIEIETTLEKDLSAAKSLQEEVDAIKKYLGV